MRRMRMCKKIVVIPLLPKRSCSEASPFLPVADGALGFLPGGERCIVGEAWIDHSP